MEGRVGEQLPGGWRLNELIDVGGMAGIFASTGPDGDEVAIKLMRQDIAHPDLVRRRFHLEAEISQRVDHDRCLRMLHQNTTVRGEPFLVMERLYGETVEEFWRAQDKRLDFLVALRIVRDILPALAACHREGVIHRDLKPSNIFLTADGHAVLFDFGVAKLSWAPDELAGGKAILGTPAYMAPEQAMGTSDLDERADVFAVGATLFALISGQRVNAGEDADESFVIAATTPAPSLATVAPSVPSRVALFVNKSMSWERRDRFQSADEMAAALAELLDDEDTLRREAEERAGRVEIFSREVMGQGADLDDPAIQLGRTVFEDVDRVFRAVRTYGWSHNEAARQQKRLFNTLRGSEGAGMEHRWWVTPAALEVNGAAVWVPEAPFDDVPYNLFVSGFRTITLLPSLSESELFSFLQLLLLDPIEELDAEDDLSTVFIEQNLESILVEHVSPLENIALLEGVDTFEATIKAVKDEARTALGGLEGDDSSHLLAEQRLHNEAEGMALALAQNVDLSALNSARRMLREVDGDLEESPAFAGPLLDWDVRLPRVLASALSDARFYADAEIVLEPIAELVRRWLALERFEKLLALYAGFSEAISDTATRLLVVTRAFGGDTPRSLLDGMCKLDTVGDKRALIGLGALLNDLGAAAAPVVLGALIRLKHPDLFEPLLEFIKRNLSSCEVEVQHLLRTGRVDVAHHLIDLVATQEPERAIAALRQATRSAHLEIQSAAIARRVALGDNKVAADLIRLLEAAEPARRVELFMVASAHKVSALRTFLGSYVDDPHFHGLSVDERAAALDALHSVDPGRALAFALDVTKKRGLVSKKNRDGTKAIAIRFLGRVGDDDEVEDALRVAAKGSLLGSKEIKKIAAEALASMLERREAASE